MITRAIGESMGFTGGAETTPIVRVATFRAHGSMNDGAKNFRIEQNGQVISLSEATMRSILEWGCKLIEPSSDRNYTLSGEHAQIYTVEDWFDCEFTGEDGYGVWGKDGFESSDSVFTTKVLDATHVFWYPLF
jgi:hypothetical protein